MRSWSIPAGRIFGVDLRIDLSFVLLLLFIGFIERTATHAPMNPMRGILLVAIIFGSVVLHELGHALVGRRFGIPPRAIILMPIGGVTIFDESQPAIIPDWKRDIKIAIAGPMVNLFIAAVSALIFSQAIPGLRLWDDFYVSSNNLPHSLVWSNLWL